MNKITRLLIKIKTREKKFLYFSYIANVIVISVLFMIATGINNITNESLSENDLQQVKAILSSVIFVSAIAIIFFQWIISMQFRALFDSRKQFNNNMRLMGIRNKTLLQIYMKEMFYMQIFLVPIGIVLAEVLYYMISYIMQINNKFIGVFQIVFSVILHLVVISLCILFTYKKMVRKNIIDELRKNSDRNSISGFSLRKKISLCIGMILTIISTVIAFFGNNSDLKSWGEFGCIIGFFMIYDLVILIINKAVLAVAKKNGKYYLLMSEHISFGYFKKVKVVCILIMFSSVLFLGMQMLYRNVRACGSDVVEHNVHYEQTVWYDELHSDKKDLKEAFYGLKYKVERKGSIWYITGIDSEFMDHYETLTLSEPFNNVSTIEEDINDENWDGIVLPNYYISDSDIGKKIDIDINGKTITFTIVGGCFSNNLAHTTCYVSKSYLQKQLSASNAYNIIYLKNKSELDKAAVGATYITESFDEIRQESYEKAISGTSLVEMLSIIIIVCAMLSLMNYFALTAKANIIDISRLRGVGVSRNNIFKIYTYVAISPVLISIVCSIPLSILFAKIGCLMVLDEGYYKRSLILTPSLTMYLFLVFIIISVLTQIFVIRKVTTTSYYIEVLRDVNI